MLFDSIFQRAALAVALLTSTISAQSITACNNSPSLCSRSYSNITHLGAHDSPFLRDSSTSFSSSGNQFYNSTMQLAAGVRLLSAQVHNNNGSLHLCHSSCVLLDAGTLSSWLSGIKSWMDSNPNEVVTLLLVNSDNADASTIAGHFTTSGLSKYAYTPASTTQAQATWPTLEQMISNGTRLVTFVADLDPSTNTAAPYLLDEFTFAFENNYDVSVASNFSCQPDRPSSVSGQPAAALKSNRLFIMNHFLYSVSNLLGIQIEQPNEDAVNVTNAQTGSGSLGEAGSSCTTLYGKKPFAVLVDFFNVGPAIATVDALNGITASGRTQVSTDKLSASNPGTSSGSGRIGVSGVALILAFAVASVSTGF